MELKKTVEVINHVWVDDLNTFIHHNLGTSYPFSTDNKHYPEEHYISKQMSKFDYWVVEKFLNGEPCDELNLGSILNYLCKDELMDEGYYLIERRGF